jgi:hypothetical protein
VEEILDTEKANFYLLASFASWKVAEDALAALSFSTKEADGLAFLAGIRCGFFYNESDVTVVIGGSLLDTQIQEVKEAVQDRGRIRQIHGKLRHEHQPAKESESACPSPRKWDWWRFLGR